LIYNFSTFWQAMLGKFDNTWSCRFLHPRAAALPITPHLLKIRSLPIGMDDNAAQEQIEELVREAQQRVSAQSERREAARPKSGADGLKQGLGKFLGGLGVGAAGLIATPYAAYKNAPADGKLRGTLEGVVGGIAIAVVAPVVGTAAGVNKIREGMQAGHRAANASSNPLNIPRPALGAPPLDSHTKAEWDRVIEAERAQYGQEREVLYNGRANESSIPGSSSFGSAGGADANGGSALPTPKDTELYEVLGVEPTATQSAIKSAYRRAALRTHPDRNPGCDGSEFKKVGEAFQVLSDDEKRLQYHRHGVDGVDDSQLVSAEVLFSLMLAPKGFKPIIGDVAYATSLSMGAQGGDEDDSASRIKEFNKIRVTELADLLVMRVEPYVAGRPAEFIAFAEREASVLSREPLGRDMLHAVGNAYKAKSKVMLGKQSTVPFRAFFSELADIGSVLGDHVGAAKSIMDLTVDDIRNTGDDDTEGVDSDRRKTVTGLSAIFLSSLSDISTVLREVVEVVCTADDQPKEVLARRTEAISLLGGIFLSV
jgi:curved DNA-binding protein CbpA